MRRAARRSPKRSPRPGCGLRSRATRRTSHERLADVALRASVAALVVTDGDGLVRFANSALARVAGGVPRDPVGTRLDDMLVADGGAEAQARLAEALRGRGEYTGDATLVSG